MSDLSDISEPPMANGELVFAEPWQGRVFGVARALSESGLYSWDEFREYLIEAIAGWDGAGEESEEAEGGESNYAYYDHFLKALEKLLADKGFVAPERLLDRCAEYRQRPHGHDHEHH